MQTLLVNVDRSWNVLSRQNGNRQADMRNKGYPEVAEATKE